jgi:antitoxin VapB
MSLNVKNPEATRLIRELADATGESMTQALTVAVRERLDRIRAEQRAGLDGAEGIWGIVDDLRSRLPAGHLDQDLDALIHDEATGLPK